MTVDHGETIILDGAERKARSGRPYRRDDAPGDMTLVMRKAAVDGGEDVWSGCGERGVSPVDELVARFLVDHQRRGYQQPVAVAAGVLASGVQQQPVVQAVPADDGSGIGVLREALAGLLVGDQLNTEQQPSPRGRRRSAARRWRCVPGPRAATRRAERCIPGGQSLGEHRHVGHGREVMLGGEEPAGAENIVGPEFMPRVGGGAVEDLSCRAGRLAFADEQPYQAGLTISGTTHSGVPL